MHSYIYQIEDRPVQQDDRISENYFYDHLDDIPADYVSDIEADEEEEAIGYLSDILPQSMFRCEGREITFLGGDAKFFDEWKEKVEKALLKNSSSDIANGNISWRYLYALSNAVNNVLDVNTRFYTTDDGYCTKSTEFILGMMHAAPGTKLYVGAVIDYHC